MKVRICPACGSVNAFANAICENESCREGLLDVPITDTQAAASDPGPKAAEVPPPADAPMRKCARCGKVLPYRFTQCECGAPMFGPPILQASEAIPKADPPALTLCSDDGRFRLELASGVDVTLGRSAVGSEYLTGKGYVSRQHARIVVMDGGAALYSLSRTNPTLVNGRALDFNRPYALKENDRIALGAQPGQSAEHNAAYFRLAGSND